jgi:hypothetical protein
MKERIHRAQIKASLAVNRELMQLYWDFGGPIVKRQRIEGWGKSVLERPAADIQKSPRNGRLLTAKYLVCVCL